ESRSSRPLHRDAALPNAIVRTLPGNLHVVHVALAQPRASDAHKVATTAHRLDGAVAGVAHGGAQASDELVQDAGNRALVGDLAFDAFGDELLRRGFLLEIPIGRAAGHGPDRAHTAERLEAAPLVEDDLAGRLIGA